MTDINSALRHFWQIKKIRILSYSLAGIGILLVALPFIIQLGLAHVLVKQGATDVAIEDVNLNLFSGEFELIDLDISTLSDENIQLQRLYLNLHMLDLFSSRIIADQLEISGLNVSINRSKQGKIYLNGFDLTPSNETQDTTPDPVEGDSKGIEFGINQLALSDIRWTYSEDDFRQSHRIGEVSLSNLRSWDSGSITNLNLSMLIDDTPVKFHSDLKLFGPSISLSGELEINRLVLANYKQFYRQHLQHLLGTLDVKSKFELEITPQAEQTKVELDTESELTLNDLELDYQHIHQQAKSIRWNGNLRLNADHQLTQAGKISITSSKTLDRQQQMDISLASLELDTDLALQLPVEQNDNQAVALSGKIKNQLSIDGLNANYKHINHTTGAIQWSGDIVLDSPENIDVKGNLGLTDINTSDTKQAYRISHIDQFNIDDIHHHAQVLSMGKVTIQSTSLVEQQEQKLLQLSALSLSGLEVQLDSPGVSINDIQINQPDLVVTINEDKTIRQIEPLLQTLSSLATESPGDTEPPPVTSDQPDNQPFEISIGQVTLINPGSIDFTDSSVSPHYQSRFKIQKLDLSNIAPRQPGQFELAIQQGEYTQLELKGQGQLLDPKQALEADAKITHLDLPPVTSYTSKAMGYGMKSGAVDSDIKLLLKQNEIDAQVKLKIDSVEVVETNSDTAQQINSASGMSIDLALSTLKDSDDVIELELPIKGNIDNPDFDLSQILNKAMGKAMKSASLAYLKHSLQPFGSLLTLYNLASAAANYISLAPVLFETNSLEFKDQQQELLAKVTQLLKDRPGIKIKTCAISNRDDQQAIKQQLLEAETEALRKKFADNSSKQAQQQLQQAIEAIKIEDKTIQQKMTELANQRSARVKAYFLEQSGVEAKRILNCLSKIETEGEFKPSVELQI